MRGLARAAATAVASALGAACLWAQATEVSLQIGDLEAPGLSVRGVHAVLMGAGMRELDLRLDRVMVAGQDWRKVRLTCADLKAGAASFSCATGVLHLAAKIPVSFSYSTATQDVSIALTPTPDETWRVAGRIQGDKTALSLKIEKGRLDRLAPWLPAAAPKLTGGRVTGAVGLEGRAVTGRFDLEGVAFADAAGLHAGEKIAATIEADASGKGDEWRWNARLTWRGGEVFWQPLFVAAAGQRVRLEGLTAGGVTQVTRGALDIPQVGSVAFSGRWSHLTSSIEALNARASHLKIAPLYEQMLKPMLQQTALGDLRTDGEASFTVAVAAKGLQSWDLELHDVSLEDRQQRRFALFGAAGRLPWKRDTQSTGEVTIRGAEFLKLLVGPTKIPIRMVGTAVTTTALRVPVLDGALQLRDFAAGLTDEGWRWRLSGQLEPISMTQLTQALGVPVMHGSLSGVIPEVRYRRGTLAMDGALAISVFDGTVTASKVELLEPFGRAPRLHADVDFRNLNLELLTRTFDFGTITGRIDGRFRNLELVGWEPVRFDMGIESSPGRYPKRISQRAVQNISALGGAGAAAAIQRSFLRFFEQFGYDRIGLGCRLENNACEMSGIEAAPQGYVIVKGGGIPSISVIGYNRNVSWRELLDRLKRITQENVKPVVK